MALNTTAFLVHNQTLYHSSSPSHPISEILEYIWFHEPDQARSITRSRIFTKIDPSPRCLGMLKVAGKRFSFLKDQEFKLLLNESLSTTQSINTNFISLYKPFPLSVTTSASIDIAMSLAVELSKKSIEGIGAILLSPENKILSWGWNDHFKNRILHAEVMLIKNYQHLNATMVPDGSTLVTTLFPCAMCAGYLHSVSNQFSSLKIVYLNDDPGPHAQNSILRTGSHLHLMSGSIKIPQQIKYNPIDSQ